MTFGVLGGYFERSAVERAPAPGGGGGSGVTVWRLRKRSDVALDLEALSADNCNAGFERRGPACVLANAAPLAHAPGAQT